MFVGNELCLFLRFALSRVPERKIMWRDSLIHFGTMNAEVYIDPLAVWSCREDSKMRNPLDSDYLELWIVLNLNCAHLSLNLWHH